MAKRQRTKTKIPSTKKLLDQIASLKTEAADWNNKYYLAQRRTEAAEKSTADLKERLFQAELALAQARGWIDSAYAQQVASDGPESVIERTGQGYNQALGKYPLRPAPEPYHARTEFGLHGSRDRETHWVNY